MTITIVCDILGEENNGTTIACMNLIRFLRAHANGESTCSLSKCDICFVSIAVTGLRYYMP